jgi:protein SCO1/2
MISTTLNRLFYIPFILLCIGACEPQVKQELPILGRHIFNETGNGIDTIYHSVAKFSFIDQDSSIVDDNTFAGKIYVADFFFTSCPSICPLTTAQMLRLYNAFRNEPRVLLLSHTIDPDYDDVGVLSAYADKLEITAEKWHLVTGNKEDIYNMAQTSYYVGVREEDKAPGGFEHSGAFVLVDEEGRIRGMYDGTDPAKVDLLISDVNFLLK